MDLSAVPSDIASCQHHCTDTTELVMQTIFLTKHEVFQLFKPESAVTKLFEIFDIYGGSHRNGRMYLPVIRLRYWHHTDCISIIDPSFEFGVSPTAGVDFWMVAH
jgi:hypothetical protein